MISGSVTICDGCDGVLDTDQINKTPSRFIEASVAHRDRRQKRSRMLNGDGRRTLYKIPSPSTQPSRKG